MKTLNVKLEFGELGLREQDLKDVAEAGWKHIFEMYLSGATTQSGTKGLGLAKCRILNRILQKLDSAGEDGLLELEEAEFDFICSYFEKEESDWKAPQVRILCAFLERIAEAKNAGTSSAPTKNPS